MTNSNPSQPIEIDDNELSFDSSVSQGNTGLKNVQQLVCCIACKDGNFPTEMHKCKICRIPVHLLDGCSVEDPESKDEGQKRICITCSKKVENTVSDKKLVIHIQKSFVLIVFSLIY